MLVQTAFIMILVEMFVFVMSNLLLRMVNQKNLPCQRGCPWELKLSELELSGTCEQYVSLDKIFFKCIFSHDILTASNAL